MEARKILGKNGEDIAVLFFKEKGYEIVERNWHCRGGEIDLIARKGNEMRFVEVKTRSNIVFGYPEESVTRAKAQKMMFAMQEYLHEKQIKTYAHLDVFVVLITNTEFETKWIPDAIG